MPEKIKPDRDDGVELESQVILRIPEVMIFKNLFIKKIVHE